MFLKTMANMKIIHILEDPTVNLSVVLPSFCIAYSVSLTALHVMNTTYHCPSYDLLLSRGGCLSVCPPLQENVEVLALLGECFHCKHSPRVPGSLCA